MMNNSLLFGCIAFLILMSTVLSFEAQGNEIDQDKEQILQTKEVYGTVRDSVGPIPGVSVTIKNTTKGTTTDLNGKYILEVPDNPNTTLVFSMVGFDPHEIVIGNQTSIDVTLQVSSTQLGEAVVVAFGTQKRTDLIGSVTSINPSELKVPSSNLTTALAGRLAGVIAYQRSGEPGADNAEFFIRGVTTFGYKKDPLILIDNIELTSTDLARLNPDDIASFSIMKDATATALYGARGANGVILVTTKEGKEGQARVSFRLENSVSSPTQDVELADPITYMRLNNEAILTRDPLGRLLYSDEKINNTVLGSNSLIFPSTDWREELFKDHAINQRANLSVSGGGKVARYYVAGSFNQDNGVLKVDNRNNFNNNINLKTSSLRANVNINLTPTTELITRLSGTFDDYTGPIYSGGGFYTRVMRANPVLFPAYYPVDADHSFVKHIMFGNFEDGNYLNPYADMVRGYKDYARSNMNAQFQLQQDFGFITEGLSARGLVNTARISFFDVIRQYEPFYYQLGAYNLRDNTYQVNIINPDDGEDYLSYQPGEKTISSTVYLETAVNYNRTFAEKHNVSGMLVYILREALDANSATLQESLPFRNVGLSGRATYSYDNRYYAEFNFGYNGSERFYKAQRFGFFPSAGLAWTISNEKFWEPLKETITNLRLRGTYGLVGNDAIGAGRFLYLSEVNPNDENRRAVFGTNNGYPRNGVSISRYSDLNITWETAKKTNIALELGISKRWNIIAEYFREHRTNILQSRASTPASMGLWATPAANIGEAKGEGIDFSLDYNQSFLNGSWIQARANFTYATSAYEIFEEYDYTNEWWKSRVGYPINQRWGYIAESLFVDEAEVTNSPRQNFGEYLAGDIKYRDINKDGQITELDMVPIGYPTMPEIVYGFGVSYGFKNFDISTFFQGLARESFWIDPEATAPFVPYHYSDQERDSGILYRNQLLQAYADSYWSEDNRDLYALFPRLSTYPIENNIQSSTWFLRNGAFLRLKQVELGYTVPTHMTEKIRISNLRIYANGTNLLTWSKFDLWDIEMAGNGLRYPVQKVYNIGIQASF
ncbi:SusC/RagA family TonB-linked outer membrane protein [Albibacterium indicum]|uniref:SusC/RagA family TonB-linked outer membrane protein n=1 Tax=Albibacterium indicum TaxID=2292082 RepID=UPI001FE8D3C5|nr:TonB-dependent receptor [Pedobacter indicus]